MTRMLDQFAADELRETSKPPVRASWKTVQKVLKPVASLRLTVVLFALCMVLVFCVTWEQMYQGIDVVVQRYIRAVVVIDVPWRGVIHKIPFPSFIWLPVPGGPWNIPFPGGWLLGALLLLNLTAAHLTRFRFSWRQIGIWGIHAGVILLLVGELITGASQVEGRMEILEGSSANYVQVTSEVELAVVQAGEDGKDKTVVIPGSLMRGGGRITATELPFDVEVEKYMSNSRLENVGIGNPQPTTHAQWAAAMPVNRPNITGTDPDQEINAPSAVVVLWKKGSPEVLGKFALSVWLDRLLPPITREVTVDGKKFDIALRFKRVYKPYTIHLTDFHHDKYIGTSIPKDYKSEVRLVDPTVGEDRKLDIWMNNPLRHGGETIYQSGFRPDNLGTVLQVVRNPGWRIPYIACTMVALGLVFHFGVTLTRFLLRMF